MLINNLLKAATTSAKEVKFKILFDNTLRGKVIGRKGENITRVRNIPNFFCSVENEIIFKVDGLPDMDFAALNVVGENMQEGLAAALELMNPDDEPRKRRRVGNSYANSSYTPYREQMYSPRTREREAPEHFIPRSEFRESRPPLDPKDARFVNRSKPNAIEVERENYKESVAMREYAEFRGAVGPGASAYANEYSEPSRMRVKFPWDQKPPKKGSEMYTPYQPTGSSRSLERIKDKRKEWPPREGGYRPRRSPSPPAANPLTNFYNVLAKANQNVFKSEFVTVLVSSQEIGGLIGNKGSIVKEINDTHNCFVSITNNFGSFRIACIAFKGFPSDTRFVDVLVEIATRLVEEREDKTLRLMFPVPPTRVDTPSGHKVIIDGMDVDVIDIEAETEADLRAALMPNIRFLRYICNLVCRS